MDMNSWQAAFARGAHCIALLTQGEIARGGAREGRPESYGFRRQLQRTRASMAQTALMASAASSIW